jgi:sodium/potassium/calcium exchanger 6
VTFVALGNGAPDLSSNIFAIRSGQVQLSAGALTGAALFVQCIVAAELVQMGGGVKCAGAMYRDVSVYCLSIVSVLIAFMTGHVSAAAVGVSLRRLCSSLAREAFFAPA